MDTRISRLRWSRPAVATVVLAVASGAACLPAKSPDSTNFLAGFREGQEVVVAYQMFPACDLQRTESAAPIGQGTRWIPVEPNELANRPLRIEAKTRGTSTARQSLVYGAMLVADSQTQSRYWVRNQPVPSARDVDPKWRCFVDRQLAVAGVPKLAAGVVELSPRRAECDAITPLYGSKDGITFLPYTVTRRSLFLPPTGVPLIGVRIESDGGEKALTIPAETLDRCFEAADRPPPPPAQARAFSDWLALEAPDSVSPPVVARETVEDMTGLAINQCVADGTGATAHYECRMPILRIVSSPEKGPYGPSPIRLVRERLVDALHLYAGKLVSPAEIASVNAAVRLKVPPGSGFSKHFDSTLAASIGDAELKHRRASQGFRLMRTEEISQSNPATHYVDMDVSFHVPEVETTTERRTHKYVAGTKTVPNPKHAEAEQAVADAKSNLANAEHDIEMVSQTADTTTSIFGMIPGAGSAASAAKQVNSGVQAAASVAKKIARDQAMAKLNERQQALARTPPTISVPDEQVYEYSAKVLRRRGTATASLAITAAGRAGQPQLTSSVGVQFDASDVEIPDDPTHKLTGKAAKTPTNEDVQRSLAQSLIPRIDEVIIKWGAQRQVGGNLGDMKPGTRSWMVAVARHAAGDRPIKLVSDILENRPEILKLHPIRYPVKVPEAGAGKCFTFAAISVESAANVNLEFGRKVNDVFVTMARDKRAAPDAAFEMCGLKAGDYQISLSFEGSEIPKGALMSMFDSTLGGPTNADTIAASKGLPTTPRHGETLALNGEGVVQFKGTADQMVTGRTGDRDGDGIPDDEDRCPYDPETKNGYLDEDGCPDVPGKGFVPPPAPAPSAAPTPPPGPAAALPPRP